MKTMQNNKNDENAIDKDKQKDYFEKNNNNNSDNNNIIKLYIKPGTSEKLQNDKAEKITSLFKRFYQKISLLKQKIVIQVTEKIIKIQSVIRSFLIRKTILYNLLVNYLLRKRNDNAVLIQRKFRLYFYIQEFNKILDKERKHYSVYFLMNAKNKNIHLHIVVSNDKINIYPFEFCKARQIYVAYVPKTDIFPTTYLCSFIIDGIPVLDSRYSTVYSGQNFYNKIDFKTLNKENEEDSDDEEDEEDSNNKVRFHNESKFFNLKNIDYYRKKIENDIKDEFKTGKSSFFSRNNKKSGSNLSLNSLRKAEIKRSKKLQYVKSLSELLKKEPLKSILRTSKIYRKDADNSDGSFELSKTSKRNSISVSNHNDFCFKTTNKIRKRVTILSDSVDVYENK